MPVIFTGVPGDANSNSVLTPPFEILIIRYKFQSSAGVLEDKVATLTDADTLWTEVRHMHMREAIDKLMGDFNKFLADNAVFQEYVSFVLLNDSFPLSNGPCACVEEMEQRI